MIGQTVSHYRITEKLGEGGMGVVYKAEDVKLNRPVALKFLAAHLLKDEEARKRFHREAKAAAALSHPNVCRVYEIDEVQGQTFIAMELVEGESLDSRIKQGPLKIADALDIAQQIAKGLEAAHEKKTVHRDIKPGNVVVDSKAHVTVMDFGLALLTEGSKLTKPDTTVGTVAYMSPEQAEGADVDHRTDIWALGCVLYEMVSGRRPFKGQYDQALLYEIVHEEPEALTALRTGVPIELELLVSKCLAKPRDERYQNVSDLIVDVKSLRKKLEPGRSTILRHGTQQTTPVQTTGKLLRAPSAPHLGTPTVAIEPRETKASRLAWLPWGLTALLAVVTTVALWRAATTSSQVQEEAVYRFALLSPEGGVIKTFALSPDGRHLVFVVVEGEETTRLWLRPLDEPSARALRGTEGADPLGTPFWSPDSRFIGFFAEGKLKKVDISGAPPEVLADAPHGRGGTWSDDGTIVFAPLNHGQNAQLFQVAASGGEVSRVTSPGDNSHRSPFFLPDGRQFLFFARVLVAARSEADMEVRLGSLNSKETTALFKADSHAALIPPANPGGGHLLLTVRDNVLLAYHFDAQNITIEGDPVPLVQDVGIDALMNRGFFSVSETGSLAYAANNVLMPKKEILWVDRRGRKIAEAGPPGYYYSPRLSPDGTRVAILGITNQYSNKLFLMDPARRLVGPFAPEVASYVGGLAWYPDSERILFRAGETVYLKGVGGRTGVQVVFKDEQRSGLSSFSWSPDGKWILGVTTPSPGDLSLMAVDGEPRLSPYLESEYAEDYPEFSPDGRWVVYTSDESGREEVYVRPFPQDDRKWQVSVDGGTKPLWGHEGKELFYVSREGNLMAVPVQFNSSTFQAGDPQALFPVETDPSQPIWRSFDVDPDGERFLVLRALEETAASPVRVVVNWFSELRELPQLKD